MPDYIYLLENRLSPDQRNALHQLREAAREAGTILFLTGDAVRDLTSGQTVRGLEVTVHGNALELKKAMEKLGGSLWGEDASTRSLYLCFPGTVRVDVLSAHRVEYPKPGQSILHWSSIQEDLRRRDFTVNAMAISLNEGSFGLLMDPTNGVADIEAQTLRLVSNYGFLEEPSLLIRAIRYRARLGFELDPKTQTRYENAKEAEVIESLSAQARSQELEQIGHEEDGLKILQALEAEGWMQVLFPAWTPAKADEAKLAALHQLAAQLLAQGVHADMSAAQMQLLTAKLSAKDLAALKKLMLRPGFLEEWNNLDKMATEFAKVLLAAENRTASAGYRLFTGYDPEAVLWLGFTSKVAAVQERYEQFLKQWPEQRQRIPHALMQEMRITPELVTYNEIVQSLFLELIDGRLGTTEELRAFLEPHSPPAPPPQVTVKKTRAKRGDAKLKESTFDEEEDAEDTLDDADDLDEMGMEEDEVGLGMNLPKISLQVSTEDDADSSDDDEDDEREEVAKPVPAKRAAVKKEAVKKVAIASADASKKAIASKPKPPLQSKPKPESKPEPKPDVKSKSLPTKEKATSSASSKAVKPAKAVKATKVEEPKKAASAKKH